MIEFLHITESELEDLCAREEDPLPRLKLKNGKRIFMRDDVEMWAQSQVRGQSLKQVLGNHIIQPKDVR